MGRSARRRAFCLYVLPRIVVSDDRLWVDLAKGLTAERPDRLFGIDFPDGDTVVLDVPGAPADEDMDRGPARFTVTDEAIYHVRRPWMHRYEFDTEQWSRLDSLYGATQRPVIVGNRMYVLLKQRRVGNRTRSDAIVRAALDGSKVEVLASTQRQPPRHALDQPDTSVHRLYAPSDDPRLYVQYMTMPGRRYGAMRYDPAVERWEPVSPAQLRAAGATRRVTDYSRRVDFRDDDRTLPLRVVGAEQVGGDHLGLQAIDAERGRTLTVPFRLGEPRWLGPDGRDVAARGREPADRLYREGTKSIVPVITPHGLLLTSFATPGFWFLPHERLVAAFDRQRQRTDTELAILDAIEQWQRRHRDRPASERAGVIAVRSSTAWERNIYLVADDGSWWGRLGLH